MTLSDDPLGDDIRETLLPLAKSRAAPRSQAPIAASEVSVRPRQEVEGARPPGAGTMAARTLAACEPGAWLSAQDVAQRIGVRPRLVAPNLHSRLWARSWVEQIDDPDAKGRPVQGKGPRGPRKLWRLTALGEAVRAAVLQGATQIAEYENRPLLGVAESPTRRLSASSRRRRRVVRRAILENRA